MNTALEKANDIALRVERDMAPNLYAKRDAFIATLNPSQRNAFRELEDLMIQEAGTIQAETVMAFSETVH